MAPSASRISFSDFTAIKDRYPTLITSLSALPAHAELDNWRLTELPLTLQTRKKDNGEAYLTKAEAQKLIEFKLYIPQPLASLSQDQD
jgi:hypothetical protein